MMRNKFDGASLLFILLVGLFFPIDAAAQPTTTAEFEAQCYTWIEERDLAKLVWTVRYYRSLAQPAFTEVLRQHREKPTKQRARWLNTVARAFRLEGMGRPNRVLKEEGILWPITRWRGTMFQADGAQGEYDLHRTWD